MDLSLWRQRARIVAYIDLVLSSFALLTTVLMVIFGVAATAVIVTNKDDIKEELAKEDIFAEHLNIFIWAMWVGVTLMAIIVAIDMWAVIMLLKATNREEHDRKLALDRARIWRNVAIVFLIFSVVYYGGSGSFISLAVDVVFRGVLLYVVCKFITALEHDAAYAGAPEGVMIKH